MFRCSCTSSFESFTIWMKYKVKSPREDYKGPAFPRHFGAFGIAFVPAFCLNLIFFFAKIECGLYFLDRFDVLMSKMILKK